MQDYHKLINSHTSVLSTLKSYIITQEDDQTETDATKQFTLKHSASPSSTLGAKTSQLNNTLTNQVSVHTINYPTDDQDDINI